MFDIAQTIFDSRGFGDVVVTRSDDCFSARFGRIDSPVVTIERIGERTRPSIPIGTKDASCLAASVDDRPMKVIPGKRRVLKRGYRVVAVIDDRVLTLEPTDVNQCRLLKGTPGTIEQSYCTFTLLSSGKVYVEWKTPPTTEVRGHTVESPQPTDEDVLIGFALASAFGIGSISVTEIVLNLIGSIV